MTGCLLRGDWLLLEKSSKCCLWEREPGPLTMEGIVPRRELTELKKTLNVEVEQLRSEFQELRNTLHHQQEDVTASLRNLGLQDVSEGAKEAEDPKVKLEGKDEETLTSPIKENGNEVNI
ncbi:hypothetical protein Gotri_004443 [Gossypium trilobum]|uniref:Uncharacterized protein n=1 Tax=Gossypium trilobum TaxID=34281 RepID=A0A7J9F561_9ROSI|nr:hypothetical protein [Gossypium trilobum]